jgi:Na+/melibiose symporter-like transporter
MEESSSSLLPQTECPPSAWKKLAFGVGAAPASLANTVIGFFFTAFLLEVAEVSPIVSVAYHQIPPLHVTMIVVIGRVWDAFADPAVGFLASRTNTRWGHLRPW